MRGKVNVETVSGTAQRLKKALSSHIKPGAVISNSDLFAIARRVTPSVRWQSEAVKELVHAGYLKSIDHFKFIWIGEKKEDRKATKNMNAFNEKATNSLDALEDYKATKNIDAIAESLGSIDDLSVPKEEKVTNSPDAFPLECMYREVSHAEEKGADTIVSISTFHQRESSDSNRENRAENGSTIKKEVELLSALLNKYCALIFYYLHLKKSTTPFWELITRLEIVRGTADHSLSKLEKYGIIEVKHNERAHRGQPSRILRISTDFRNSSTYAKAILLVEEVLGEEELRKIRELLQPGVVPRRSAPPSDEEVQKAIEAVARVMFRGGDFREAAKIHATKLGIHEDILLEQAKKRYDEIVKSIPGRPSKYYFKR